jgi:hypothetical protein
VKAIRLRHSQADGKNIAAVRVRVDPAEFRDDLLDFLRASSCLAVKRGANEIEAHLLNSVSERHDRAVINGSVAAWQARHGRSVVEVVSSE